MARKNIPPGIRGVRHFPFAPERRRHSLCETPDVMAMSPEKKSLLLKDIRQLVIMAAVILTGRSVLADWYVVPTGSMKPTILEGDRVFVWKSAYQIRVPVFHLLLLDKMAGNKLQYPNRCFRHIFHQ